MPSNTAARRAGGPFIPYFQGCMRAALQGLRTIGPLVVGPFCEIVKLRNRLAKLCGAEDFYDYTVKQAEGFSKRCAPVQALQRA